MKIKFFEKESDFIPRMYSIENIVTVDDKYDFRGKSKKYNIYFLCLSLIMYIVFTKVFFKGGALQFILIYIPLLICHEFCHALFAVITGRKIRKISFISCGIHLLTSPFAYVELEFGAYNKTNSIMLRAFPLVVLTLIPMVLAVLIEPVRYWMLLIAFANLSTSQFDIVYILCFLRLPKNTLDFGDFHAVAEDPEKPVIIHRLSPSTEDDKIDHLCYSYFGGELTEIEPYETEEVEEVRQQLVDHLNKNDKEKQQKE